VEVTLQLKTADGTVGASLGYESQVDDAVKELGLRMYPVHPGTQDSKQATLFRIPVPDAEAGQRAAQALEGQEGVQSVAFG
jgi:hypothetical protein